MKIFEKFERKEEILILKVAQFLYAACLRIVAKGKKNFVWLWEMKLQS